MINHTETSVHKIFEAIVSHSPDKPALLFGNKTLTYCELNRKANQMANFLLAEYDVKPEETIAILSEPSEWIIISILAILKTGCHYLPLSGRFPVERIHFMLNDSKIRLALTHQDSTGIISSNKCHCIVFQDIAEKITHFSDSNIDVKSEPDDIAYVMYTSGTTGIPNGVEILHRGIVRLVCGADYIPFDRELTFLQLSTFTFDASTFEIWGALLNGHKLVMYDQSTSDFVALKQTIEKNGVNCIWLTAALFNIIIEDMPEALTEVKYLLIGGEALSAKHVRLAQQRLPNTQIINGYGPTETTTFATTYRIPLLDSDIKNIPIGSPIYETEVLILNENLEVVENGEEGEIFIGGKGLARGYRNQPRLTTERFIQNPNTQSRSNWLYRTGDIGRKNANGEVEFITRKDFQIKIRGFRVEVGEIENAFTNDDEISQSAVIISKSAEDTTITAFIVSSKSKHDSDEISLCKNINTNQLKLRISKWLPDYMIPGKILEINIMPLTLNGKIDKTQLLKIENSNRGNKIDKCHSYYEHEILYIWKEIFNNTDITIDSNFIDVGGFSLLGVRLIKEINDKFSTNINLKYLYKAPTIRQLAQLIETKNLNKIVSEGIIQIKDGFGDPLFLLPGRGDDAFTFVNLVRYLNTNKPIYVIEFPTKNHQILPYKTMSEIADIIIPSLEKINPTNKYNFIGYSFGGRLAFELATQLQKKDQVIGHLSIIDIVGIKRLNIDRLDLTILVLLSRFKRKITYNSKRVFISILTKFISDSKLDNLKYRKLLYPHYVKVMDTQNRKKTIFNGDITLIRTNHHFFSKHNIYKYIYKHDPYIFWKDNIVGNIDLFEIKCNHHEFLSETYASKVADILNIYFK